MNPELNQDDINIEDFLYTCLDNENEDLNLQLDSSEIFNVCLISTFDYYNYWEQTAESGGFDDLPDESGEPGAADNNICFYAMFLIYGLIPIFTKTQDCEDLRENINQVLASTTVFLNAVSGANKQSILDAKPFIETLSTAFTSLLNNLVPICNIYGWDIEN